MMLRAKAASYALLALYEIARQHRGIANPSGVRASDIAEKYQLPKAYAAKILSHLANAGVLHSDRGPRGGFRLNRAAEEISLFDIFGSVGAIAGNGGLPATVRSMPAPVQTAIKNADREAAALLKNLFLKTSVADIVGKEDRR